MRVEYKDFRGQTIEEGCRIVYAVAQGSTVEMREAEVLEILEDGDSFRLKVEAHISREGGVEPKIVFLSRVDRVAVVP